MSEVAPGDRARSRWVRVGELLRPHLPDPARPNAGAGATPLYFDGEGLVTTPTGAFPLYRVQCRCPRKGCGRFHERTLPAPQYDDDQPAAVACEPCLEDEWAARRERFRQQHESDRKPERSRRAHGADLQRPRRAEERSWEP